MKKVMLFVVMIVFFAGVSIVSAGDRVDISAAIRSGESFLNTVVRERSRVDQERENTRQTVVRENARVAIEQERRNRDVAVQQERTTETIGSEQIREKRDVSVEAIRSQDGKSVKYQRGGETIAIDIQKTQSEFNALVAENQRLKAEIENLRLKLQKQQLQNQVR